MGLPDDGCWPLSLSIYPNMVYPSRVILPWPRPGALTGRRGAAQVERQCLMTEDEAQASNKVLPKEYRYRVLPRDR